MLGRDLARFFVYSLAKYELKTLAASCSNRRYNVWGSRLDPDDSHPPGPPPQSKEKVMVDQLAVRVWTS